MRYFFSLKVGQAISLRINNYFPELSRIYYAFVEAFIVTLIPSKDFSSSFVSQQNRFIFQLQKNLFLFVCQKFSLNQLTDIVVTFSFFTFFHVAVRQSSLKQLIIYTIQRGHVCNASDKCNKTKNIIITPDIHYRQKNFFTSFEQKNIKSLPLACMVIVIKILRKLFFFV